MTTKKGASNLSRIGCVLRNGKWIDASEEIDEAIAKAYEQGKKDAYKEILKKAEATELTDLDDFFDWLEEASE